jgi:outer membrane protein TolC
MLNVLYAQLYSDSIFVLPDSAKPFTIGNFYELVLQNHPVAKQAELLSETGKQEIRLARGNFDPKIETQYLLKHYDGTEYYRLFDASVKVPTRSPLTPSVGIERNKGENLNPENYISNEFDYRQFYAGVSLPLGQGLMTDDRRVAIKQAELFSDMMEAEQVKVINKLLLEAAKDYWQWYFSYYNYRLAANTTAIAEEIFRRTRLSFDAGENSQMDTVQARITYLERLVSRQEAFVELQNSQIRVSSYLWDSLMNPLDLPGDYVPVSVNALTIPSEASLTLLVNQANVNHPDLQKLNLKLGQIELEKKLATEYMKPKLDLSYYMLNQPINPEGVNSSFSPDDNFKLGVDFSFPLFLRKERSKVAQAKLKLSNTRYERDITSRQITNEINAAYNQLVNSGVILQQQRSMADHYYRLMNAELLNLENGESDLFKINIQQEKLFNAQLKLIKVMADYQKQQAYLYWAAGTNPLEIE